MVITVGNISLSFHRAVGAITRRVLESHGHTVRTVEAAHEELFRRQAADEIDVLVSAWLPASHGAYLSRYEDRAIVLSALYHPYCVWAVPPYVPETAVAEVADLARSDVRERMTLGIDGINPGAGISRFSARIVSEYGLDRVGYRFTPGTEDGFKARVERGIAAGEWFVIPLWRPYYLNLVYGLRPLAEPKGLLGGVDAASPIVRGAARDLIGAAALDHLNSLRLENDAVEQLDALINVDGCTPLQAADQYLGSGR